MLSAAPFNWQLSASYFVVAHFHYVLVGAILTALFGAFYYWYPKITGRMLHEGLGKLHFWLFLIGFHLTFDLMHIPGLLGMPRRIYTYEPGRGWDTLNFLVTIGAFVQGIATLVFVANLVIHSAWDPNRTWVFVPQMYMWLLALGWCAACSTTDKERVVTSIALLCMTWISSFWGTGILDWYMVLAALALVWFEEIPARFPRGLVAVINGAAAASLIIYLTHGGFKFLLHVFPPLLSVTCAMVGGFLVWKMWNYVSRITLGWFGKPTMASAPTDSW